MNKLVIISAPSGAGKTTIVNEIMNESKFKLMFSVSATSRQPRDYEQNGREYYFLSVDEFKQKISENKFVEWQEVYNNQFYGTLKQEVDRIFLMNKNIIFDVDVVGALNIKKVFPENSITIFIQPPSIDELKKRLINRGTETPQSLEKRVSKAEYELTFAPKFDKIIINDDLQIAIKEAKKVLSDFLL